LGIIEKQGIRGTMLTYVGVGIGFITQGVLMPRFLSLEQNGVLDLLTAWSLIFATLATLGINNVTNRLFPYFRDQKTKHNGYLRILMIVTGIGFILSIGLYIILRSWIISMSEADSGLFPMYADLIIPLTAFTALFLVLDIFNAVLFNAVRGILYKDVLQRVFILLALGFFYVKVLDYSAFVLAFIVALSLPGLLIVFSLLKEKEFVLRREPGFLKKDLARDMFSVASFGILVSFSNIIIQNIDKIMIGALMTVADTGIYGKVFFYGTLVAIPIRALSKISAVVVAQAWKENDLKLVADIYKKSTMDQLIIGLLVFIGLWANLHNIIHILTPAFAPGKNVIVFIGLSNLALMSAGVSGAILSTSNHYKILSLLVLLFGISVVVTNLIFIPWLGLTGAAVASAISATLYSFFRVWYLKKKFGMQPYTFRHLLILVAGGLAFLAGKLIPELGHGEGISFWLWVSLDILLRSGTIVIVFSLMIHFLKLFS